MPVVVVVSILIYFSFAAVSYSADETTKNIKPV